MSREYYHHHVMNPHDVYRAHRFSLINIRTSTKARFSARRRREQPTSPIRSRSRCQVHLVGSPVDPNSPNSPKKRSTPSRHSLIRYKSPIQVNTSTPSSLYEKGEALHRKVLELFGLWKVVSVRNNAYQQKKETPANYLNAYPVVWSFGLLYTTLYQGRFT